MCNVAHRQIVSLEDGLASEIGHRNLRRRNQVERRLGFGLEQVLLELGQLPGSDQRLRANKVRHVGFRVTMLTRVRIKHELNQRPL